MIGQRLGSRLWSSLASDGGIVIGKTMVALAAGDKEPKEPKEPAPKPSPEPKDPPQKSIPEKIYNIIVPDAH